MTQYPLEPSQYLIPRCALGELLPMEERLFYEERIIEALTWDRRSLGSPLALALMWDGEHSRNRLGWSLLDHLEDTPLFQAPGPLLALHRLEGAWRWRSLGSGTQFQGIHLDVNRLQRLMQQLGLLDHSRREEWMRSVGLGLG